MTGSMQDDEIRLLNCILLFRSNFYHCLGLWMHSGLYKVQKITFKNFASWNFGGHKLCPFVKISSLC